MAWSWLDSVSSGPKTRKFCMFCRMTSRRKLPRVGTLPAKVAPGFLTSMAELRKSGISKGLRTKPPFLIEKLLGLITAHPGFQYLQVTGIGGDVRQRDLVRSPEAFQIMSIHFSRGRPTLRATKNNHRPAWPESLSGTPCLLLEFADLQDTLFQRRSHRLVHTVRVTPFHKIRCVPVADEQRLQLLMADAGQEGRVIDLVAIEVQDLQHRPVRNRIEELVTVPASSEGTGLRLAVTHHY